MTTILICKHNGMRSSRRLTYKTEDNIKLFAVKLVIIQTVIAASVELTLL
jgi:hypothetical protein